MYLGRFRIECGGKLDRDGPILDSCVPRHSQLCSGPIAQLGASDSSQLGAILTKSAMKVRKGYEEGVREPIPTSNNTTSKSNEVERDVGIPVGSTSYRVAASVFMKSLYAARTAGYDLL